MTNTIQERPAVLPFEQVLSEYYKELGRIKFNLDSYKVLELNFRDLVVGREYFFFASRQHLRAVAIGLHKLYEDSNNRGSIKGLLKRAKNESIRDEDKLKDLLEKYNEPNSKHWQTAVPTLVAKKLEEFRPSLELIKLQRDKRFVHLTQEEPDSEELPSFDQLERLLCFADDLHMFLLSCTDCSVMRRDISDESLIQDSLISALRGLGINSPRLEFS